MMPNLAGRADAGLQDKDRLAEYRARQGANTSAVTPILKDIQGRRTGLVIGKRISKDSEGFEDIDAFWELASEADDGEGNRSGRASRRTGAGSSSVGRYSQDSSDLGLGTTPSGTVGRRSSGVSSLGAPLSEDVPAAKSSKMSLPAEAIAAARSRRESTMSTGSSTSLSSNLDDSMMLGGRETSMAPVAATRRLDFLKNQTGSLGGSALVVREGKNAGGGGQDSGEESEAPTEEEFEGENEVVAAVASRRRSSMSSMGGPGGVPTGAFDDDWAAGADDDGYMGGDFEEEEEEEASPVKEVAEKKTKAKKKKASPKKKKKAAAPKKTPENGTDGDSDTELSEYDDDDPTRTEERRKTQQYRRMRLSEYNKEMGGKSLVTEEDGLLGERRSTRRRVAPLQFWKGERALYKAEAQEGVDERKKGEGDAVDVMRLAEVQLVNTPKASKRKRKGKGGKAGKKKAKGGKAAAAATGTAASAEEVVMRVMDPEKIFRKHPDYHYVKDGSGKGKVWDEKKALRTTRRVVIRQEQVVMRPLENEEEDGVALEAGHAFRVLQVARSVEDREEHEPSLAGYPGWVAGHMTIMPRKGKDPENVGPCSQVFHVLGCEKNSMELAVGEMGEEAFSEATATRFLLGPGDTFHLPPMNIYRLYNHSKRVSAKVFWTIVKPWSQEDEEATQTQTQPSPKAPTPARGRKSSMALSGSANKKRSSVAPKRASVAAPVTTMASESEEEEEEEEVEEVEPEPSGEESESEQGEEEVEEEEEESSDSDASE